MKNIDWKDFFKKCFGKEKDDRYHAIMMLTIYGLFFMILIIMVRLGGSNTNNEYNSINPTPNPIPTPVEEIGDNQEHNINENDINYSYSYTITHDGISEVYLGKKIDNKEKFTLIRDGITTEYAILNDNYLILENGSYHITENPSKYFKYCDVEKILMLVENEIETSSENEAKYNLSNSSLASYFKDTIITNNEKTNMITLTSINDILKNIDMDFSNYITSIEGEVSSLIIHMEFVDVGKTDDFEIKVS